jgi:type I restriction-modification system DNA methylase subunit
MNKNNQEKRKARKKQTAEDFTPASLVNEMLDKLNEYGKESWEEGKTFCDPACGNGNMLVEVLKRKISLGHDPVEALKTIYGTDIMQDNIRECRLRLLKIIKDNGINIEDSIIKTVFNNIVWTSLSKYPNGSLDYEFKFPNKASTKDVLPWVKGINEEGWLEDIETEHTEANVEEGDNNFTLFDVL